MRDTAHAHVEVDRRLNHHPAKPVYLFFVSILAGARREEQAAFAAASLSTAENTQPVVRPKACHLGHC